MFKTNNGPNLGVTQYLWRYYFNNPFWRYLLHGEFSSRGPVPTMLFIHITVSSISLTLSYRDFMTWDTFRLLIFTDPSAQSVDLFRHSALPPINSNPSRIQSNLSPISSAPCHPLHLPNCPELVSSCQRSTTLGPLPACDWQNSLKTNPTSFGFWRDSIGGEKE